MASFVMISGNWWKEVRRITSISSFEPKCSDQNIEVSVDFPKDLVEKLEEDPLLLQVLSDAGSKAYKALISDAADLLRATDRIVSKEFDRFDATRDPRCLRKARAATVELEAGLMSLVGRAEADIPKAIMGAWANWCKRRKDYRDYKIRAAAKIGLKLTAIALAIAKLVGTAGADGLAWRTLIKDTLRTVDELVTLAMTAEQVRARAEFSLKAMLAWQEKIGDGAGVTVFEVGLGLIKAAFGPSCLVTFDSVSSDTKAYKAKLLGIEGKAHDAARKLQKLLAEVNRSLDDIPPEDRRDAGQMAADIEALIARIGKLGADVRDGTSWCGTMGKILEDMQKVKSVSKLGRMLKAAESIADLGIAINGWVEFASKGGDLGQQIAGLANNVGKNYERWKEDVDKVFA